jgi:hypothetical protein
MGAAHDQVPLSRTPSRISLGTHFPYALPHRMNVAATCGPARRPGQRIDQSLASSARSRRVTTLPNWWQVITMLGRSPMSSPMARALVYQSVALSSCPVLGEQAESMADKCERSLFVRKTRAGFGG